MNYTEEKIEILTYRKEILITAVCVFDIFDTVLILLNKTEDNMRVIYFLTWSGLGAGQKPSVFHWRNRTSGWGPGVPGNQ